MGEYIDPMTRIVRENTSLRALVNEGVGVAGLAYMWMLTNLPETLRAGSQEELCVICDFIAKATNRPRQEVQDEYESLATKARLGLRT
jgi:hypothetical protein